jgi:multidrug transporter EmrE-like cation transporter
MAWIYLLLAGLLEIGFTTSMRFTDGAIIGLKLVSPH